MRVNVLLLKASMFNFLGSSINIVVQTYATAVFLQAWTSNRIAYLYLVVAIITMYQNHLIRKYLKNGVADLGLTSQLLSIVILVIFSAAFKTTAPWAAFTFGALILPLSTLVGASHGSVIGNYFSMREYKMFGPKLSAASSLGAMITGTLVPVLLAYFHQIILLYLSIGLFVLSTILVYLMRTPPPPPKRYPPVSNKELLKYPLFFYVFALIILVPGITTLTNFNLMTQLAHGIPQQNLGQFLAPFYAIVNIITVFSLLYGSKPILQQFGVIGLMVVFPIGVFFPALLDTLIPSATMAIILAGATSTLKSGYYSLGSQSLTNVFPNTIRSHARFLLSNIGGNLGAVITSSILVVMSFVKELRFLGATIVIFSLAILAICLKSKKYYTQYLQEAISLHRFNLDYFNTTETDQILTRQMAEAALQHQEEDVQLFGLDILQRQDCVLSPQVLLPALSAKSQDVRHGAIQYLQKHIDPEAERILELQLKQEKNSAVIWDLVQTLLKSSNVDFSPYISDWEKSLDPALQASVLLIRLHQNLLASIKGLEAFIQNPDSHYRVWGARLMASVTLADMTPAILTLLQDDTPDVVNAAISAARQHHNAIIIEELFTKTADFRYYTEAQNTLQALGPQIFPQLKTYLANCTSVRIANALLSGLAKIPEESASRLLIDLMGSENETICMVAEMQLAYRACSFPLTATARETVRANLEALLAQMYHQIVKLEKISDEEIKAEIEILIQDLRKRFIYLLAAKTGFKSILDIVPNLLLKSHKSAAFHRALELLEYVLPDRAMTKYFPLVFDNKIVRVPFAKNYKFRSDPWIRDLIHFKQGKQEGLNVETIQKVLLLRKVNLFSGLSPELLQSIAETLISVDAAANEIIFKEGDIADGLYIVAKGEVVAKHDETLLKTYKSADFFGELALLDGSPRRATMITTQDSLLYRLPQSEFERITDDVPEILKVIVKTVLSYLPH